mgnify:CR=1 FL=1
MLLKPEDALCCTLRMKPYRLGPTHTFPSPELADRQGLLAIGGDLSPQRLLAAYREGIFPWPPSFPGVPEDLDPLLWYCPDPRAVLPLPPRTLSRTVRRALKNHPWTLAFDRDPEHILRACALTPRSHGSGTWLQERMIRAFLALYELGYMHTLGAYDAQGHLVAGLYGVSIGKMFAAESMFTWENNASKVVLASLLATLSARDFHFVDVQVPSDHLFSYGLECWPRKHYLRMLRRAIEDETTPSSWRDQTVLSQWQDA